MKRWLVALISDGTPKWLEIGASIEKKDLNVVVRYWFGFISNTIMPSQNECIVRLAKATYLGYIIDSTRLKLGMIIAQEMVIRAKQRQTSFPFPILITELCRRAQVPKDVKKDMEFIPTSSTDIWRIEVEYLKDQVEMKEESPADSSSVIDTETKPAEPSLPTPAPGPSCTCTTIPYDAPSSSVDGLPPRPGVAASRTPLTYGSLLRIGQLAHSVDRRAARLEASIPGMIQTALVDVVTPLSTTIDALAAMLVVCECDQGDTEEVTALKVVIAALRSEVDQLKSIDMSMIFGIVEIPDIPVIPPATTRDVHWDDAAVDESEAETDEEQIEMQEEIIYRDLPDLQEMIVQSVIQTSLTDTSLAASSGAGPSEVTPGTDTQVQTDAPGTDAQTNGATK
uniref:Putative plant transposon protein domain-containing protein n=1 Tax=Solanum tuberosum TaxID=4113 RepID=M1DQX1_SOLTU